MVKETKLGGQQKSKTEEEKGWSVYILECLNGSLYTGISTDIQKRFEKHKTGKGAKYTQRNKVNKIVYTEDNLSVSEARKRENEIKNWTKKDKESLIESQVKNKGKSL